MIIIAYIDEANFEALKPHRDASVDPGSTDFAIWVSVVSADINTFLGTDSDVCAFGDATSESYNIMDVAAELLEEMYIYYDDLKRTPLSQRGNLKRKTIFDLPALQMKLGAGEDGTDDPDAYTYTTDYYGYGSGARL